MVSIIIPSFNGAKRIGKTLQSLLDQDYAGQLEIIIVDDGSTDNIADVARVFGSQIKVLTQRNQGPAAARNHGASVANGDIILFTDDDCIPNSDWVAKMTAPFERDAGLVGVKGCYRTKQQELTARFVQIEHEDKYDVMKRHLYIDFVDAYSAGFRKDVFLKFGGYDTTFPVACAEDLDLSFRMSAKGCKMAFIPDAFVTHTHSNAPMKYFRKKYKTAFRHMMAVKMTQRKFVSDSLTPLHTKLHMILPLIALIGLISGLFSPLMLCAGVASFWLMIMSTIPFTAKAFEKDPTVGSIAPLFLIGRASAQFLGVLTGTLYLFAKKNNFMTS